MVGTQKRTNTLHHFTNNTEGRRSICRASKNLPGSAEVLVLDQAPFIHSPAIHEMTLALFFANLSRTNTTMKKHK